MPLDSLGQSLMEKLISVPGDTMRTLSVLCVFVKVRAYVRVCACVIMCVVERLFSQKSGRLEVGVSFRVLEL